MQSQLILAQRLTIRLLQFELGAHDDGTIEETERETSEKYDIHLEILNKVIALCNDQLGRIETWCEDFDYVLQEVRSNAGKFVDDDGEVVDTVTWMQQMYGGWKKWRKRSVSELLEKRMQR